MISFAHRTLTPEDVKQYDRDGFFMFGPLLQGEALARTQAEVDRLWQSAGKKFAEGQGWLANSLLNGVHQQSALVRDIFYRSPLVDAMTLVIGPDIKAASNQLTFKQPGDKSPFQWHQDNGYGTLSPDNGVSCWLALDDVDENNGCLWIISGSHRDGAIEHAAGKPGERLATPKREAEAKPIRMKAGECVFFHSLTLHMSRGNNTDRMRRAYFFRYADADAVEIATGEPRIGKLLRGKSRFDEITQCSELVCHPQASKPPAK